MNKNEIYYISIRYWYVEMSNYITIKTASKVTIYSSDGSKKMVIENGRDIKLPCDLTHEVNPLKLRDTFEEDLLSDIEDKSDEEYDGSPLDKELPFPRKDRLPVQNIDLYNKLEDELKEMQRERERKISIYKGIPEEYLVYTYYVLTRTTDKNEVSLPSDVLNIIISYTRTLYQRLFWIPPKYKIDHRQYQEFIGETIKCYGAAASMAFD